MRKEVYFFFLIVFLFFANSVHAQTNAFTYQGRLTDGATAANGTYEMQFSLYNALTGGSQQGSTITNSSVSVTNGLFTIELDFSPATPFANGADRFLEIAIRKASDPPGFTTLTPRQPITSAPFSIKAVNAASADSLSAACLLCVTDAHISGIEGSKISGTVANAANAVTAGNVSGIVQIGNGGTGSSAKNFVDLTTDQTVGGNKSFIGALSGNGSGLNNVPGTLIWQIVAGTSQQAVSNTGYVANNAGEVTITLPAAPNVGDIVRVSGTGSGGWKIAQNAGQSVPGENIGSFGQYWVPHESNRDWTSVATSADGSKLVAVASAGRIYTSVDFGVTWTPRESNRGWSSVASSADGSKLVAVVSSVSNNGRIYTSADFGVTWTVRGSPRNWWSVASSADGTKLVAAAAGERIYTSIDSGITWTARESDRAWKSVASSADGTKLVAVARPGQIYTSIDSGETWTPRSSDLDWGSVASSADGTKLIAAGVGVHTSVDSGVTWTPRPISGNSVASSADGSKLVAMAEGGKIYMSLDSGVTWKARESEWLGRSVASSADGTRLVAVVIGGQIYTLIATTIPGSTGYVRGEKFSAIELQYIGGGIFLPLSYTGTIGFF